MSKTKLFINLLLSAITKLKFRGKFFEKPGSRAHLFCKFHHHHHQHKHQGLDPLIRTVSRVTAARANASSIFQLFSFLVVYSGMISKGFGFVAFFANVLYVFIYLV